VDSSNLRPTWTNLAALERKQAHRAANCFAAALTLALTAVVLAIATVVSKETAMGVLCVTTFVVSIVIAGIGAFINAK
jgi:ABC-type Co2+ transport system permease subunit